MTSARPPKSSTPLPEGLDQFFDELSMDVLENFGIDGPALLNQYCCALEDALIQVNDERTYLRQHVGRLETQLATLVGLLREETPEQQTQSD